MEFYKVEETKLRWLIHDSLKLDQLDASGVDNWIGYESIEHPTDADVDHELRNYLEIE